MWIGKPKITATLLPKIGDREDFSIRAEGPGDTDYTFPLSLTGTVLAIWNEDGKEAAEYLAGILLDVSGTASAPPEGGFWFDSYNSGDTLKETDSKIRNQGVEPFAKGTVKSGFIRLLGRELFEEKEKLDKFFLSKYGYEFFRSFDDAFETSQAIGDLNAPAKDNAHFLYRVCILSGFIDHINVRLSAEPKSTLSLQAFKNWLKNELDEPRAAKLTTTFQMIKNLRKQYPIHEHYTITGSGQRILRDEIRKAREYFNIKNNFEEDWHNVFTVFARSLKEIQETLQQS